MQVFLVARMTDDALATCQFGASSLVYRVESYDRYIIEEIWEKGEYFLERISLGDGEAIIDIGGHIGAFAVKAASQYPAHPIVTVEPVPANFRLLEKNLALNECDSVSLLNAAIMGSAGEISVHLDPKNTAGHSTVVAVSDSSVRAEAITLADLLERYGVATVGLLKIDCEGAEFEIVLESPSDLWTRVHNLVLEYHPVESYDFEQLKSFLQARGFAMTAHKDGYFAGQGTALFQRRTEPGTE